MLALIFEMLFVLTSLAPTNAQTGGARDAVTSYPNNDLVETPAHPTVPPSPWTQKPTPPTTKAPTMFAPLTNATIRSAVSDWCEGGSKKNAAESTYGLIENWDTSKVTSMRGLFQGKYLCNPAISNWNTSNVIDMSSLFQNAAAFNQPLGKWNTAKVTTMASMFFYTSAFNQDLGSWNVAAVKSMNYMFSWAVAFNQKLCWTKNPALTNVVDIFSNSACPVPNPTNYWVQSCWGVGTPTNCTSIPFSG